MLAKALQGASTAAEKIYIESVFSTFLYTGNGSTQTITNGIDLSGEGGLVWYKSRNNAVDNALFDTARGAGKLLISNTTDAEGAGYAQSFTSSGFSLTNGGTFYNGNGYTYASWTFRKAAKFFDVVTYTGNGVSGRQILHNLGSTPGVVIVKRTDMASDWMIRHRSINTYSGALNLTDPIDATYGYANQINDLASTYFSVGGNAPTNANGGTYVAYLFAHDAGGFGDSGNESVVKCGTFTTDASGNNAGITLGWEPQWLLIKRSDATGNWTLVDSMRGITTGGNDAALRANSTVAEFSVSEYSLTATGFAVTGGDSSSTFIYIAIRRGPMKTPTDATKVFSASTRTGTGVETSVAAGFPVDTAAVLRRESLSGKNVFVSRLTGNAYLASTTTDQETSNSNAFPSPTFDLQDGIKIGSIAGVTNASGGTFVDYFLRRAPGFFDVVAYTGDGVIGRTVTHNLGVKPDLMIVKNRSAANAWRVYDAFNGATKYMTLNDSSESLASSFFWNNTEPTATTFTLRSNGDTNGSGSTYIAYLFASAPGVSKVGSYTGTGTTKQIDCGFTAGARFVLIKRTDSTGDWYVWDTARGIVSGNDSYLLLNSTAAEVTNTDYIDPLNSGFEISSTAPAAINANGGSFIFLAIA